MANGINSGSVTVPVNLELKVLQSSLAEFKKVLAGLEPNTSGYRKLSQVIQETERHMERLQLQTSKPFIDQTQFTQTEKTVETLEDDFIKMRNTVQAIKFSDLKLTPEQAQSIKDYTDRIEQLKNNLKGLKDSEKLKLLEDQDFKDLEKVVNTSFLDKSLDAIQRTLNNKKVSLEKEADDLTTKLNETLSKIGQFDVQKNINQNTGLYSGNGTNRQLNDVSLDSIIGFNKNNGAAYYKRGKNAGSQQLVEYLTELYSLTPEQQKEVLDAAQKSIAEVQKLILSKDYFKYDAKAHGQAETAKNDIIAKQAQNQATQAAVARGIGSLSQAQTNVEVGAKQIGKQLELEKQGLEGVRDSAIQTAQNINALGNAHSAANVQLDSFKQTLASTNAEFLKQQARMNSFNSIKMAITNFMGFNQILNLTRRAVTAAINHIKQLDTTMNGIAIVTDMTTADLWNQVDAYSAMAQRFGTTIQGAYEVSKIYYQAGYETNEVLTLTNETLKLSKISGLDYATTTDYMMTAMRGFKLEMEDASRVVDVYSNLAANTAVSQQELAEAMTRTASSMESVGASFEETSAMIATMVAVTRESANNIGSALKSIASRYGELKSDPTKLIDEEGEALSFNKVDTALKSVGITLQTENHEFRDFSEVIMELAEIWDNLTSAQQRYIATVFAGNRQQSRFLALVSNKDLLKENLENAMNSQDVGSLQAIKALDSLDSKIKQVQVAYQQFYTTMGIEEGWKGFLDGAKNVINTLNGMPKVFGKIPAAAIIIVLNAINLVKNILLNGISNLANILMNGMNEAKQTTQQAAQEQTQTGESFVENLTQGIQSKLGGLKNSVQNVVSLFTKKVPTVTNSPQVQRHLKNAQQFTTTSQQSQKEVESITNLQGRISNTITNPQSQAYAQERDALVALNQELNKYGLRVDVTTIRSKPQLIQVTKELNDALEKEKRQHREAGEAAGKSAKEEQALAAAEEAAAKAAAKQQAAMKLQNIASGLSTLSMLFDNSSRSGQVLAGSFQSVAGALYVVSAAWASNPIGAIVTGITMLVAGINSIVESPAEKLERLTAEAEELTNEAKKAKAEFNDLDSGIDKLKKLKEKRNESTEAAKEYQAQVDSLAESFPQLISGFDEAGQIIIDVTRAEDALAKAREATQAATLKALKTEEEVAKGKVTQAQNEIKPISGALSWTEDEVSLAFQKVFDNGELPGGITYRDSNISNSDSADLAAAQALRSGLLSKEIDVDLEIPDEPDENWTYANWVTQLYTEFYNKKEKGEEEAAAKALELIDDFNSLLAQGQTDDFTPDANKPESIFYGYNMLLSKAKNETNPQELIELLNQIRKYENDYIFGAPIDIREEVVKKRNKNYETTIKALENLEEKVQAYYIATGEQLQVAAQAASEYTKTLDKEQYFNGSDVFAGLYRTGILASAEKNGQTVSSWIEQNSVQGYDKRAESQLLTWINGLEDAKLVEKMLSDDTGLYAFDDYAQKYLKNRAPGDFVYDAIYNKYNEASQLIQDQLTESFGKRGINAQESKLKLDNLTEVDQSFINKWLKQYDSLKKAGLEAQAKGLRDSLLKLYSNDITPAMREQMLKVDLTDKSAVEEFVKSLGEDNPLKAALMSYAQNMVENLALSIEVARDQLRTSYEDASKNLKKVFGALSFDEVLPILEKIEGSFNDSVTRVGDEFYLTSKAISDYYDKLIEDAQEQEDLIIETETLEPLRNITHDLKVSRKNINNDKYLALLTQLGVQFDDNGLADWADVEKAIDDYEKNKNKYLEEQQNYIASLSAKLDNYQKEAYLNYAKDLYSGDYSKDELNKKYGYLSDRGNAIAQAEAFGATNKEINEVLAAKLKSEQDLYLKDALSDVDFYSDDVAKAGLETVQKIADILHVSINDIIGQYDPANNQFYLKLSNSPLENIDWPKFGALVADSQASIVKAISDYYSAALEGNLSSEDKDKFIKQLSDFEIDTEDLVFTDINGNLQLSVDSAIKLYNELSNVKGVAGSITLDTLQKQLAKINKQYETQTGTLQRIAELEEEIKIADSQQDNKKLEQYKEELKVAQQIRDTRLMTDSQDYNFMKRGMPGGTKNAISYLEYLAQVSDLYQSATKDGRIGLEDAYTLAEAINYQAEVTGEAVTYLGVRLDGGAEGLKAAYEKIASASTVYGGKAVLDFKSIGGDFIAGADEAGEGFMKGYRDFAKKQAKMYGEMADAMDALADLQENGGTQGEKDGFLTNFLTKLGMTKGSDEFNKYFEPIKKNYKEFIEYIDNLTPDQLGSPLTMLAGFLGTIEEKAKGATQATKDLDEATQNVGKGSPTQSTSTSDQAHAGRTPKVDSGDNGHQETTKKRGPNKTTPQAHAGGIQAVAFEGSDGSNVNQEQKPETAITVSIKYSDDVPEGLRQFIEANAGALFRSLLVTGSASGTSPLASILNGETALTYDQAVTIALASLLLSMQQGKTPDPSGLQLNGYDLGSLAGTPKGAIASLLLYAAATGLGISNTSENALSVDGKPVATTGVPEATVSTLKAVASLLGITLNGTVDIGEKTVKTEGTPIGTAAELLLKLTDNWKYSSDTQLNIAGKSVDLGTVTGAIEDVLLEYSNPNNEKTLDQLLQDKLKEELNLNDDQEISLSDILIAVAKVSSVSVTGTSKDGKVSVDTSNTKYDDVAIETLGALLGKLMVSSWSNGENFEFSKELLSVVLPVINAEQQVKVSYNYTNDDNKDARIKYRTYDNNKIFDRSSNTWSNTSKPKDQWQLVGGEFYDYINNLYKKLQDNESLNINDEQFLQNYQKSLFEYKTTDFQWGATKADGSKTKVSELIYEILEMNNALKADTFNQLSGLADSLSGLDPTTIAAIATNMANIAVDTSKFAETNFQTAISSLASINTIIDNIALRLSALAAGTFKTTLEINTKVKEIVQTGGSEGGEGSGAGGGGGRAKGNVALVAGSQTLMGELGPELYVTGGHYYVAGQNGAEFVNLPDDAIVFNHLQTQRLLKNGSSGRGKAVTNEKKATSFATGNVSGPALASARDAANQLRKIQQQWQAIADKTFSDLASMAGKKGGGGGGGSSKDNGDRGYITDLERWYNLLRQIEKLQRDINYEEKLRSKIESDRIINGTAIYESQKRQLKALDEEIEKHKELARLQRSYYQSRVADLNATQYSKIFTFTEDGLMQYNDNAIMKNGDQGGLAALSKLNATDINGSPVLDYKQQYNLLSAWGFGNEMLYDTSGKKMNSKDKDYYKNSIKNFWDKLDAWKEELDGLYDSYNEQLEDVLDNEENRNKILQEIVDNQISLENQVLKAIEDREQRAIDEARDEREALQDSAEKFIDGLTDQLEKERHMYEKQETQNETDRLRRQLAILQRSGGSASQIRNLQNELTNRDQDAYFQAQQDQIDAVKEASDLQLERLDKQIDLMEETLEYQKAYGLLWNEVYQVMDGTEQSIYDFITGNTTDWSSKSILNKQEETRTIISSIQQWLASRDDENNPLGNDTHNWDTTREALGKMTEAEEEVAKKAFEEEYARTADPNAAQKAAEDALNKMRGVDYDKNAQEKVKQSGKDSQSSKTSSNSKKGQYRASYDIIGEYEGSQTSKEHHYFFKKSKEEAEKEMEKRIKERLQVLKKKNPSISYYPSGKSVVRYANGGLIDYTGPAWVDGTKSKPEGILNAEQLDLLRNSVLTTRNPLTNILTEYADLLNSPSTYDSISHGDGVSIENVAVNMNVARLANDYDARRAADAAMEEIVKIARKSTVNNVSRR